MAGVKDLLIYFGFVAACSSGVRMWYFTFQFERKNVAIPGFGTSRRLLVYSGRSMWSKWLVKLQWKSYY